MAKKTKKVAPKTRKPSAREFYFRIDAFTPSTIPMARLAEYMAGLAVILGEPASVHFVKLQRGSTILVHRVQSEAVPKVRDRARAVRRGDAPRDALRAYENINNMLLADNGTGELKERDAEAVIIPFPGERRARTRAAAREAAAARTRTSGCG